MSSGNCSQKYLLASILLFDSRATHRWISRYRYFSTSLTICWGMRGAGVLRAVLELRYAPKRIAAAMASIAVPVNSGNMGRLKISLAISSVTGSFILASV